MGLIRILTAVIGGVLKAATESFLGLVSVLLTSLIVLAVVAVVAFSISGVMGLGLSRRQPRRR